MSAIMHWVRLSWSMLSRDFLARRGVEPCSKRRL